MPWCGIGSSDVDRASRRNAGLRGPRRVRASARRGRPPGGVGAADRRRRRRDRRVVALAGPDARAALRSLPVRLREPVRTARHLQRDAAAAGRAGRRRVHDDPLPARPARVHRSPRRPTSSTTTGRWSSRPADFEVCGVGDTRSGALPGIAVVFLAGVRGGGDHVSPDRRRARARAHASARSPAPRRTTATTGTSAMSPTT